MSYCKMLVCFVLSLCLGVSTVRGQCPNGYVPINTSMPSYDIPNWLDPNELDNDCWQAFQSALDAIATDFTNCQKEKSPSGYPNCTTANQQNMCLWIRNVDFNRAYDAYVDCIITNYPPPANLVPPNGTSCPSGWDCIPNGAEDVLPIILPWEGFDENDECYGTYVQNMKSLHQSYINGITTCDHNGFYCWDCSCVEFWKETYQNDAEDLYDDYLNCIFGA